MTQDNTVNRHTFTTGLKPGNKYTLEIWSVTYDNVTSLSAVTVDATVSKS